MDSKLYPCLWFDGKAHEAADYYCSIFPNSKIVNKTPMVAIFELNGNRFMGLNAGPEFQFNEAVSFVIRCEDQEEVDHYWEALTKEGKKGNVDGLRTSMVFLGK